MDKPKTFAEGIYFNEKPLAAPDYVIGKLNIEVQRFISFLIKNQSGERMKLDIKRSKNDPKKIYMQIDTYDPTDKAPRSKEEQDTQIQYPDNTPTIEIDEEIVDNF